jgi:hypothetical protein
MRRRAEDERGDDRARDDHTSTASRAIELVAGRPSSASYAL